MNVARNAAFGKEAAKMVLGSLAREWPKVCQVEHLLFGLKLYMMV